MKGPLHVVVAGSIHTKEIVILEQLEADRPPFSYQKRSKRGKKCANRDNSTQFGPIRGGLTPGACPDHLHLMQVRKKREKRAFLRRTAAAWPLEPS
jgi:hypothetical protein